MIDDLVHLLAQKEIHFGLLVTELLGERVAGPYSTRFLRVKHIRAFGEVYTSHANHSFAKNLKNNMHTEDKCKGIFCFFCLEIIPR